MMKGEMKMENGIPKADPQLELDLTLDSNTDRQWEVIVRYNGDINRVAENLGVQVEVLSEDFAIITLPAYKIRELAMMSEIEYIEIPKTLTFVLDQSLRQSCIYGNESAGGVLLRGNGVAIGIIDSGIDYTHPDFINEDGSTRIISIWDQGVSGNPPTGFNSGTEYTREEINEALNTGERLAHTDTVGHGTHVASIAAGNGRGSNGRYRGVASDAELIVVKLGETGREYFARTTELMRAIKYILDKARFYNMPVAINISYGTNDGSHDGQSLFETYINEMSNHWRNSIVVAMGNEGVSAHHYRGRVSGGTEDRVEFNVQGNIRTMFLSMWKSFVDTFTLELIAPSGQTTGVLLGNNPVNRFRMGDTDVFIAIGEPTPYNNNQEIYFRLIANENYVNNGIWTIRVIGNNVVEGSFDIWLPVTESVGSVTAFINPDINTTLTLPAAAQQVISVGGYDGSLGSVASFSGRGYTRDTNFVKPDIVAPAVNITAAKVNGGYDRLSGTSMAAPHVTGAGAILMQWGIVEGNDPFMFGERLKSYLQLGARRRDGIEYPNREWGYGELCLANTLNILKSRSSEITIQQMENIEEMIYSNDYEDLIVEYNTYTERILQENNIRYCNILENRFVIIYVDQREKAILISDENFGIISGEPYMMGLMQGEPLEESGITQVNNRPFLNLRGQGTLIGIIDTGIDYRNEEFIYEDGSSKIEYIWDQSIPGNPPRGFCYGTEFSNEEINRALSEGVILDTVDEIGHGTRLAQVSGGRNGAAPDAGLIVVKLKAAKQYLRDRYLLPRDVPAYQSNDLVLAVEYIYNRSMELGKPVSIAITMGTNGGGRTGNSDFEIYLSDISVKSGICLSVAMGNEGTARHHTEFSVLNSTQYYDIEINVGENEEGFPVWIWSFSPDIISVGVVSPIGETIDRVPPQNKYSQEFNMPLGSGRVMIEYSIPISRGGDNLTTVKLIRPISGIWRIRVYGDSVIIGSIHAWLPLEQFTNKSTAFLSPTASTTLTVPASARSVIAVGGYNSYDNSLYAQTGRGPTRFNLQRPFLVAPAVNVNGITGTSAATAITAGAAALLLEWGIVRGNNYMMNTITISTYLIRGATKRQGEIYPNNLWGYGTLNLYGSFEQI